MSLVTGNVEHLFRYLHIFFGKVSVQIFAHFVIGSFVILLLRCLSSIHLLNTNPLSGI